LAGHGVVTLEQNACRRKRSFALTLCFDGFLRFAAAPWHHRTLWGSFGAIRAEQREFNSVGGWQEEE
jgi:hypothetical protein